MKCKMGFGHHPHHHGFGKWKHQKHCSDQGDVECQNDGNDQEVGPCKRGHGHGPGPHKHGHGHGHGHGPHKHGHGHHPHGPGHDHGHGPHKHGHGLHSHSPGHDHGHGPHKHGHGHHPHGPAHDHGHGPHKHGHGHHPHGPGHDHGHGPHKHGHGHHNPLDFLLPHFGALGGMHHGRRGGHFGHGRGGHGGHHFGRGALFGHGMRGGHFGHRGHHGRRGRHFGCEHPEQTEIDPEILRDHMIDMVDDGMLQFGCYLSSLNQDSQDDHNESCIDCEADEPVTVYDATNSEQMYTATVALGQGVKPSGIKISLKDYVLTVEGKIEVISDDGSVTTYEEFTKRVTLPDNVKKDQVKTVLLPDGVLTIQAPLVPRESTEATTGPTEVPIIQME